MCEYYAVFAGVERERQGVERSGADDPELQVAAVADVPQCVVRGRRRVALHRRFALCQFRPLPLRRLPACDAEGRALHHPLATLLHLWLLPHCRHLRVLLPRPENGILSIIVRQNLLKKMRD
jgi:hypothetical protein